MLTNARRFTFMVVSLLCVAGLFAQQQRPANQPGSGRILLDVVVTPKSGPPVSGLQQQDFTVLDNKVPQTITSFQAVDARQAPIEIVLVIDAVNTGYERVAYERIEIDKFLRGDAGRLAYPSTLAVLTDKGLQGHQDFSTDGTALAGSLDQYTVSLRTVTRAAGFFGAEEILQTSIQGLHDVLDRAHEASVREASRAGRKIILWVSPGWPLLSGPEVVLSPAQQQQLFSDIVNFSTELRRSRITLYSIDPLGTSDLGSSQTMYWRAFVKGISKPSQVQVGDLALEVLATQSGGLALNSSNDVAGQLRKCLADLGTYYEISFDSHPGDQASEYHSLEVRVAKRGLIARTRQGYYSQP